MAVEDIAVSEYLNIGSRRVVDTGRRVGLGKGENPISSRINK